MSIEAEGPVKLMSQEEEAMTPYNAQELAEGWEFKIVRAGTKIFREPERLRAVLEEERKGGWTLVEKFDDNRIRLKRPAGANVVEGDCADGYDLYRTTVDGFSPAGIAVAIATGAAIGLMFLFLVLALTRR